MCHQYIKSFGNRIPISLDCCAAIYVKSPVEEGWLPRTAPNFKAVDRDHAVLKVNNLPFTFAADQTLVEEADRHHAVLGEHPVMVPSNHHLVTVRLLAEPMSGGRDLVHPPHHGKVSGVDEDVPFR